MKFLIRAALAAVMSVAAVAMAAPPAHAASTFKYTIFQSPPQELTDPFLFHCYHLALPQVPIISVTNNTSIFPTLYKNGDCTDNVGPPMSVGETRNLTLQQRVVAVEFTP